MAKANKQSARSTFLSGDWDRLRSWELAPLMAFYTVVYSIKELVKNRGTILTASLAFVTALSVVPLLSVVISALAGDTSGSVVEPYLQQLFPAAASEIANYLEEFASTSATEVGAIGLVAFVVIGLFLFISIERVFNIVWSSERRRPILQKAIAFITLMTFGPVLASASIAVTGAAQVELSQFGADVEIWEWVMPPLLSMMLFWAMHHFLPTAKVRWWASCLAGAFTAMMFELGKFGFNLYVTEIILVPYNQVYGAFGLLPLFLIWLYVVWLIIIFAAELAYTTQNLQTIVSVDTASSRSPGKFKEHVFSPLIGLELYAPIARAFKSGEGRVSERDLVTKTGYPEPVVRGVVSQLEAIGALDVVEDEDGERRLLPAKQLDDTQLLPVVDNFFDFEAEPNSLPMARLLQGYRAVTLEVLRAESALALIPKDTELSAKYAKVRPWEPLPPSSLAESSSSAWEEPAADADLHESPPSLAEASSPSAALNEPSSPGLAEPSAPSLAELSAPGQSKPGQSKPGQSKPGQSKPGQSKPGQSKPGQSKPGQSKPGIEERETLDARPKKPKVSPKPETTPPAALDSNDGIRINTQDILVEEEEDVGHTEITNTSDEKQAPKKSKRRKKKKKDPSIEIDVAGMWDDFEVDNYDEILAAASEALEEQHELGAEKSVPPPVPNSSKKK